MIFFALSMIKQLCFLSIIPVIIQIFLLFYFTFDEIWLIYLHVSINAILFCSLPCYIYMLVYKRNELQIYINYTKYTVKLLALFSLYNLLNLSNSIVIFICIIINEIVKPCIKWLILYILENKR